MRLLTRRRNEPEPFDTDDIVEGVEQESELDFPAAPVASLPPVNLLPATYARRAAVSRAKLFAAAAMGVAVLVSMLAWLITWQQATAAEERLAAATDERTILQREAATYSHVPAVFNSIAAAERQLQVAMGNEVRWSFFLNDLALTMPSGVSLESLQVTGPAPGADVSAGATAGSATGIGTMNVSAKAMTYNTVANWLDSLAKLPTLTDPYIGGINAGSMEGSKIVTYTSTAGITPKALSQRYTAKEVTP